MPRYLIVNADDFGLTAGVSRGILQAHREGIVTSTTFMVNFPWAAEMASLLGEAPTLGVGIHLNLTVGPPVLPAAAVRSLIGQNGRFSKGHAHLLMGIRPAEVQREWSAQVEKGIRLLGRRPTHLDSHKYVQVYPRLAEVFAAVARAYAIPAVRCLRADSAMDASGLFPRWVPVRMLVPPLLRMAEAATARANLRCPDRCLVGDNDLPTVLRRLEQAGNGVSELVCHPGYVDEQLAPLTSLRGQREAELAALIAPGARQKVNELGLELVSFEHLGG